jgi:hypothetical protein
MCSSDIPSSNELASYNQEQSESLSDELTRLLLNTFTRHLQEEEPEPLLEDYDYDPNDRFGEIHVLEYDEPVDEPISSPRDSSILSIVFGIFLATTLVTFLV